MMPRPLLALFAGAAVVLVAAPAYGAWTVTAAVDHALTHGFAVRTADSEVRDARGRRAAARAGLLPRLSLSGDLQWLDDGLIPSSGGVAFALRQSWSAFLELEQNLLGGGGSFAAAAGHSDLRAARAGADEIRAQTAAEVERRFWSVALAREVLAIEVAAEAVLAEAVRLEEVRERSGAATPLDVLRARTAAANRRAAVLGAERGLRVAWEEFLATLGTTVEQAPAGLTDPSVLVGRLEDVSDPPTAPPAFDDLLYEARNRRPLLQAATANADAARAAARAAGADRWPRLALVGAYGAQNSRQSVAVADALSGWRAGLRLRWTLWDAAVHGGAQSAQAKATMADIAAEAAAAEASLAIRRALGDAEVAAARMRAAAHARDLADETLRLAQARQAAGRATAFDVRESQLAAAEARVAVLTAAFESRMAALALNLALGRSGR
jgi:outer membrane protein TolC